MFLRQAQRKDIPAMHRVRTSVRENWLTTRISEADYLTAIELHGKGWVVEERGEVIGFAVGDARDGNIWALFVHPEHERHGYGRLLHDAMVSWLWSRGLKQLWLTTEPGTRAQPFYEAAGWKRAGQAEQGAVRFELYFNGGATFPGSGRPAVLSTKAISV